jgi:hypothetical protein
MNQSSHVGVITWSARGGCAPYTGTITARYERERTPYATYPLTSRSGTMTDVPPSRCEGVFTVVYTLTLQDGDGSEVSDRATTTVRWGC